MKYKKVKSLSITNLGGSIAYDLQSNFTLKILKSSPLLKSTQIIDLCDLNPQPSIIKTLNIQWLALLVLSILIATVSVISYGKTGYTSLVILSVAAVLSSLISLYFIVNRKLTGYSFSTAGSQPPSFFLMYNEDNREKVESFVDVLSSEIENSKVDFTMEKEFELSLNTQLSNYISNLDSLYNAGMVDDFMYKRIMDNINNKLFGSVFDDQHSADIISFPNNISAN